MFLLAHGADTRWTRRSLTLLATGVLALAIGLLTSTAPVTWIGAALIEGGVGCFLWQAYCFYRVRIRKKIDIGMRFAMTALGFLAAAAVLGAVLLVAGSAHVRIATMYLVVGLLGGVIMFVVGLFYKIVPLLAWTARYRGRVAKGGSTPLPTVAQMYSARVAHVQLGLMASGVVILAAGIGMAMPHVVRAGGVLFLASVLLFASQIARVAFGGK